MSDGIPEPMSNEELRAARELADGATPGPWRNTSGKGTGSVAGPECYILANVRTVEVAECVERWQRDAAFIAWCRAGVPRLLDEVARARGRSQLLHVYKVRDAEKYEARIAKLEQDIATARMESERLADQLERYQRTDGPPIDDESWKEG